MMRHTRHVVLDPLCPSAPLRLCALEGWIPARPWREWLRTAVLAVLLILAAMGLTTLIEGTW